MGANSGLFGEYEADTAAEYASAKAKYDAAVIAWNDAVAAGRDPGPKPAPPAISGAGQVDQKLTAAGFKPELANSAFWQEAAKRGANAPLSQNPYNAGIADQSRAAQLALMQQMRGQMSGPSIANMQGQRAMGQMGQQALMQGGRAGMLGAQMGAGGLAGDVGQARLAEVMRAQAGMGGAAGNLRGADLNSARAQQSAGAGQLGLDLGNRQAYAGLGAKQTAQEAQAALEMYKAMRRGNIDLRQRQIEGVKNAMGPLKILAGGWIDTASANKKG